MESNGAPDRVNMSEMAYNHAKTNRRFVFEEHGEEMLQVHQLTQICDLYNKLTVVCHFLHLDPDHPSYTRWILTTIYPLDPDHHQISVGSWPPDPPLECEWVPSGAVHMYWVSEKDATGGGEVGDNDNDIDGRGSSLGEAMQQYAQSTSKEGNYNDAANLLESKVRKRERARGVEGVSAATACSHCLLPLLAAHHEPAQHETVATQTGSTFCIRSLSASNSLL
jgi:hypothetical protein